MPLLKRAKTIVVENRKSSVDTIVRNEAGTHKFITTRRHPIYYMAITKCGSTFLKNLFYVLDNDAVHADPDYIHDHGGDLIRADKTPPEMIQASRFAFTVMRRPVSRFMSLYFDKIYGTGPQNFPEIRLEIAGECGLDLSPNLDAAGHRDNCEKLIDWIAKNLAGETDVAINPHWRPQSARIGTVAHLNIDLLTLDGLDWQLPLLLNGVVPELRQKMMQAKSRNKTAYPVAPEEIISPALECRINEVYADDLVRYQHITRGWKMRRNMPTPAVVEGQKLNVLTTHTQNLNVVVMQKAGCTYLRNLTYRLDHGRAHPDPAQIAADECLFHASKTAEEMADGVNVIVLRDPYARFFSLYFDKVWGEGQQAFPWIAKKLAQNRKFRRSRDLSQAEHHDNCCRVLGYLQQRFEERAPEDLNPHWQPQIIKVNRARPFGVTPILLEDIDRQLAQVAAGRIKGLDDAIGAKPYRNATEKPITMEDLLSPWIKERLQALYGEDIALFERVKAAWDGAETPPEL